MTDPQTPPAAPSHGLVPPGRLVQIRTEASPVGQGDTTTTRVAMRPIAAWRMDYGRFEFDSSFIEPEAALEIPHLIELARRFPESPISLFGHADPTGDDHYNKALSGRRALAVYGLLVRDVELWDELYRQEYNGDRWGLRSVQRMLAELPDTNGEPYYAGTVDDWFGAGSKAALERFQVDHGLTVDGDPGPLSRKALYHVYMDFLCTHPDGEVFVLTDDDFLARGQGDDHRGDVQGCSEANPAMVFNQAEHAELQAWAKREERNRQNAVNRRVVIFFYPAGVRIDVDAWWPCPAARDGFAICQKRFWSDAPDRRNPQAQRRHFDGDFDTFACRFYHWIGNNTPGETPLHLAQSFDVYHYHETGKAPPAGRFALRSDDGVVDEVRSVSDGIVLRSGPDGEVRCLRITGLQSHQRVTLSFESPEGDEAPVVLIEDFTVAEYLAADAAPDGTRTEVTYVLVDDSLMTYQEPLPSGPVDWSRPPDPDHWQVEQQTHEEDDLRIRTTTITEGEIGRR